MTKPKPKGGKPEDVERLEEAIEGGAPVELERGEALDLLRRVRVQGRRRHVAGDIQRCAALEGAVLELARVSHLLDVYSIPGAGGWAPPQKLDEREIFAKAFALFRSTLARAAAEL